MRLNRTFLPFLIFLLFASFLFGYEVVLKNGKKLEGTLVSEDDSMIVLQDSSGIKLNLKKANIDMEKTSSANAQKSQAPVQAAQPKQHASAKISTPAAAAADAKKSSGKKVRQITEEDLKNLRDKIDLGEGTFAEESGDTELEEGTDKAEDTKEEKPKEKTESEWKQEAARLRANVQTASKDYELMNKQCEQMKTMTVQAYTIMDSDGKQLSLAEEREKMCSDAERAKTLLQQAKSELSAFISQAKQEGVPPGYLRNPDGSDIEE